MSELKSVVRGHPIGYPTPGQFYDPAVMTRYPLGYRRVTRARVASLPSQEKKALDAKHSKSTKLTNNYASTNYRYQSSLYNPISEFCM
ncbi:hypothetical protein PGTUg99_010834 [Puccinia graminis f. sp. tritici]|uniref:Uncharacterized protein n=1 Tax=Puccinia graminis f. sp. tritici TaxID=56615 RepID=A0A5B0Q177_PUCGR|nr:hypothetical protein PGTUg99_010834 [Puccinia graminis f. sp. tritici]